MRTSLHHAYWLYHARMAGMAGVAGVTAPDSKLYALIYGIVHFIYS